MLKFGESFANVANLAQNCLYSGIVVDSVFTEMGQGNEAIIML